MLRGFLLVLFSSIAWAAPLDGEFTNSSPLLEGNGDDLLSFQPGNDPIGTTPDQDSYRPDVSQSRTGWTANEEDAEGVDVFHGLLTNDVGLSVSNIEDVTGAVLVKSRIIEKDEAKNGNKRGSPEDITSSGAGKSIDDREPRGQATLEVEHRMAEADEGEDSTSGNRTSLLVTFVEPLQSRTAANGVRRNDVTRGPTILRILADGGDIAFEYVSAEKSKESLQEDFAAAAGSSSKLRTPFDNQQNEQSSEMDSITSKTGSQLAQNPNKVQVDVKKKTTTEPVYQQRGETGKLGALIKSSETVNLKENDKLKNRSGQVENKNDGSEQVESKLISVRGPPPPSDDPEVIHLTQKVDDRISFATAPSILIKTITATVTETSTQTNTKVTSVVKTTISTLTKTSTAVTTSTAVSTTVKTETSTVVLTPSSLTDPVSTVMTMNWPTRHTFLSPMLSSSSLDTREALYSSSQTSTLMTISPTPTILRQETSTSRIIPDTTTESSTLDPTSPDFFLPGVLRDVATGTDPTPVGISPSTPMADANSTAIFHQIKAILEETKNLGNKANRTENMIKVITMLKNMTEKGMIAGNIAGAIKTPNEVTSALQNLLNQFLESWKPNNSTQNMTGTDVGIALLENRNVLQQEEQNITQFLTQNNTHLAVWPASGTDDGISLLENRNAAGQKEQNITQFLNQTNTHLAVWPTNGPVTRITGNTPEPDNHGNFTSTNNDPFRCRRTGIEYPLGIEFRELRARMDTGSLLLIDVRNASELEETGRLPWSYNLPLGDIQKAFKMSSSAFQEKYGFPKPSVSSPHVVLTSRAGRRIVSAWNILQQFGYCNVRLYYGSFLEWFSKGGSLIPYFGKVDEPTEQQQSPTASSAQSNLTTLPTVMGSNETLPVTAASVTHTTDKVTDTNEEPSLLINKNAPTLFESLLGLTDESSETQTSRAETANVNGQETSGDQTSSGATDGRRSNAQHTSTDGRRTAALYQTSSSDGRRTNAHQQGTKQSALADDDRKPLQTTHKTDEIHAQIQHHLRDKIIVEEPAEELRPVEDYEDYEYRSE